MVQLDDIHAQNETAFYDLVVAIENSDRQLSLLLAVCDDASLQAELIDRYEAEVAPQFKPYRVTVQPAKPSIKSALADQVAADDYLQQGGLAVFTVLGANRLFRLRFGAEKSQQEEFLGYLQWTREALRQYPYPIVLWLTSQILTEISRKAPDFWSWRKSVFRFVSRRSLLVSAQHLEAFQPLLDLPDGNEETTIPLSDLERLIEQTETNNPNDPLLASLYFEAGKILAVRTIEGEAQDYWAEQKRAISYFRKALNLFHQQEPQSVQIASCLNWLATLNELQGRYEEAELLLVEALAMSKQLLGEQHPDVASNLNNLAALYRSQGRYEEAEPLLDEALVMSKQLLGEQHPDVATSLNNLAALYSSQGRYEEAEPLYREALAMRKHLLGKQHPSVATSLNNLAELYRSQGRYEEAKLLYADALALWKSLLGEQHPSVASSLNNLAGLYSSQGRYEEAESLYREALAMRKQLLGKQHPDVAISLNNLAALYSSQGRYEEAESLYREALATSKQLLGKQHPLYAIGLGNLANLYVFQKQYDKAESLYLEALQLFVQSVGQEHPYTQETIQRLSHFVMQVVADSQEYILSDHPLIQHIVQTIKSS